MSTVHRPSPLRRAILGAFAALPLLTTGAFAAGAVPTTLRMVPQADLKITGGLPSRIMNRVGIGGGRVDPQPAAIAAAKLR